MTLKMQMIAVQKTINQLFSPKVLLYGSRYRSVLHGNWKVASEMFLSNWNILLFDFIFLSGFCYVRVSINDGCELDT